MKNQQANRKTLRKDIITLGFVTGVMIVVGGISFHLGGCCASYRLGYWRGKKEARKFIKACKFIVR